MKKENKSSIFLSVIAVIILICAVLLLVLASLSFISAPKNQGYYDFIKDHGSLIAGILGFVGVFILVRIQRKTTSSIIRSGHLDKSYNTVMTVNSFIDKLDSISFSDSNRDNLLKGIHDEVIAQISLLTSLTKKLKMGRGDIIADYKKMFHAVFFTKQLMIALSHLDVTNDNSLGRVKMFIIFMERSGIDLNNVEYSETIQCNVMEAKKIERAAEYIITTIIPIIEADPEKRQDYNEYIENLDSQMMALIGLLTAQYTNISDGIFESRMKIMKALDDIKL